MNHKCHFEACKTAYISVGSNLPDAREIVRAAINKIVRTLDGFRKASSVYKTACWGGGQSDYYNCVMRLETDLPASELEIILKVLEAQSGRRPQDKLKGVVPIDLDLVVYDRKVLRSRDFSRNYFRIGYCELVDPRSIQIADYFYELPEQRIARHPLTHRDRCKLLVIDREGIEADTSFSRVGSYLPKNSMLIYNNTRVINARLLFVKPTGAKIEIFCLEPYLPVDYQQNLSSTQSVRWRCLVGNSKKWTSGVLRQVVKVDGRDVTFGAERVDTDGRDSIIEFSWNDNSLTFADIITNAGRIPIPPYLNRDTEDSDAVDYQTVYGEVSGSVAAPTAGLHFTDDLLTDLRRSGVTTADVTLHVGAGTFQPVKSSRMEGHDMHSELIDVSRDLIEKLRDYDGEITAVGTTTMRTLESLYHIGCMASAGEWDASLPQWYPYTVDHPCLSRRDAMQALLDYLDREKLDRLIAHTSIIIAPGYRFEVVSNLITNFHQPGSTLLLLVAAIVGDDWKTIYDYALLNDYRFLSYGDACLFRNLR